MKFSQITRIFILMALALFISKSAGATDLSGQVTEVIDGNTISLKSLSHTIKVRLLAAAPPEKGQPYADVARQHLSDLILGKYVVIRYTRIGQEGYLVGRLLLEQADINAQMLRDGVAWYDKSASSDLSQEEREQYEACEEAARKERRGLWQDAAPTPPWEFGKIQVPRPGVVAPPLPGPQPRAPRVSQSSFSGDDLTGGLLTPGSPAGKPTFRSLSLDGVPDKWLRFQPEDGHFSILAPSDGREITYPILDGKARLMDVHYVLGTNNRMVYVLMWAKGSNDNYTDASMAADTISGLLKGINHAAQESGRSSVITAKAARDLKLSGYSGKQYSLLGDEVAGVVRVFTKQIGDQREVFMIGVMNSSEDRAAADRFLNSFKINDK